MAHKIFATFPQNPGQVEVKLPQMPQLITTPEGTIEYAVTGAGKPVLFLHGGHSNCRETLWHKGFDTSRFLLLTPSRPGYGGTPLASFSQPAAAARLMASLLDALELDKAIVVGISAGGLTAIELAANFPDKVEKLVLLSAVTRKWLSPEDEMYRKGKTIFSPKNEKWSWLLFRTFFRLFPRKMTAVLFKELSSKTGQQITAGEVREIRDMTFLQRSGEGFNADLDQDIAAGVISRVQCPTLILHSENDRSVRMDFARHARENIPDSRMITYDNKWGHLLWVGQESEGPIRDVMSFSEG